MVICGCCVLGHRHRWRMGKPFSFRQRFFSRFHTIIISKIGRRGLVGAPLRGDRSPRTRPPTHKYGRGAIGFSFAPLPQLSLAPDFRYVGSAGCNELFMKSQCAVSANARPRKRLPSQPFDEDCGEESRRIILRASISSISRWRGIISITPVITLRYMSCDEPWRTNAAPSSSTRRTRSTRFIRTPSCQQSGTRARGLRS